MPLTIEFWFHRANEFGHSPDLSVRSLKTMKFGHLVCREEGGALSLCEEGWGPSDVI